MGKTCFICSFNMLALGCLFACSDDGDVNYSNRIQMYGETYALEQAAVYHDNNHTVIAVNDYDYVDEYEWQDVAYMDVVKGFTAEVKEQQTGNFLVSLYEEGFVVSDITEKAVGEGACVSLRLASPDTAVLEPGVYVYSANRDEYTFQGHSTVSYNTRDDSPVSNDLTEGKVTVSREGDVYSIDFDCKTSFGGSIVGSYKGPLKAFDIRKDAEMVNVIENVKLEALFPEVNYIDVEGVAHHEPDYQRATSFLATASRAIYTANLYKNLPELEKRAIDIALRYDSENAMIYFASPIEMRSWLWHNKFQSEDLFNYSFDLYCHTQYMLAPADFTEADFEQLASSADFTFAFSAEEVGIPVGQTLPCFVFVQTGNGLKGVIRINEITPEGSESDGGVVHAVNPSLGMDIKFPRDFSEEKLR